MSHLQICRVNYLKIENTVKLWFQKNELFLIKPKKIAQIAASRAHRVRCAAAGLHRSVPMETCFFFLNLFCIFY